MQRRCRGNVRLEAATWLAYIHIFLLYKLAREGLPSRREVNAYYRAFPLPSSRACRGRATRDDFIARIFFREFEVPRKMNEPGGIHRLPRGAMTRSGPLRNTREALSTFPGDTLRARAP